ncbi:fungal protease inhibitor-1-like isoform X2 [Diprion similis]|uniref:fungal protease inhibitor-1-like isoform X2 n=1 Tax=Diprion similis TaxID=362088 RepID=UPI001EF8254B|nr:fungal protease inhibitor-1-like isoform X2 [Diprion similis]
MMKRIFGFLLALALVIAVTEGIVCPPNYCAGVNCTETSEDCGPNQQFEPNSSFCGCCPQCITILSEGDECGFTLRRGYPSGAKCQDGTSCRSAGNDSATCQ